MIVAFTGHRPNKLGGYFEPNPVSVRVKKFLREELEKLNPDRAITGMALGVDHWAAMICLLKGIPYLAAVPFVGQEMAWPESARKRWRYLLGRAAEVVLVSEGAYSPAKMQRRNEWMVDHCDVLLAVWDGTAGGTANCVRYAKKKKKQMVVINPYPINS